MAGQVWFWLVEDGASLRFRHELARLAIEQLVPAHRRAGTHGRILAHAGGRER
jgi:predicted ATPase